LLIQQTISFPETSSPINVIRLESQNGRLLEYLKSGKRINCFSEARRELQIGYLNSRIADLIDAGIEIKKEYIKVPDVTGKLVQVKSYWI
jgi:hypothetical protein